MPHFSDSLARFAIAGVVLLTSVVYLHALGRAPIHVTSDEARFAVQAESIATTGRDLLGNRMPLFLNMIDPLAPEIRTQVWWQPILFYLMAATLRIAPLSEGSIRAPTACLGILNVCLIYAVGRRLFANRWYAVLAALLLASTPAHILISRMATDCFVPLSFALAWLWCLLVSLNSSSWALPLTTGIVLGAGAYSYITSWMVMPFYLVVTAVVFWLSRKPVSATIALGIGFAVPLVPLIWWLRQHPTMPREIFIHYSVATSWRFTERVSVYWSYFNPSLLFFSGAADPMFATRQAGIFLLAVAALLPCGLWSAWMNPVTQRTVIVLAFLCAPLPVVAALPDDPGQFTPRVLLFVPFGVLISVLGVEWLVTHRGRAGRIAAALLIFSVPMQFTSFVSDYFTRYQTWAAFRFDDMNLRGVAEYVIGIDRSSRVPALYFVKKDARESKTVQWKFHLLAHGRPDIWNRSTYFVPGRSGLDVQSGSLLIHSAVMEGVNELTAGGRWSVIHMVNGVAGDPAAVILRWH